MEKFKSIKIMLFLAVALISPAALAKSASVLLQEGLYAEEVDGNLDAAISIYAQIIKDDSAQRSHVAQALYHQGMCYMKKQQEQEAKLAFEKLVTEYSDQTNIVSKAKPFLQELSNADPAALMPPDTLVYFEIGSPGKQIDTILNMLKGTPLENPLAAIGRGQQGGVSPGDIVGGFLNPSTMAEFKKIRGAGVGITGIAPEDPPVIVVLFPGKSDALRGLLFGALAFVGKPIEAVEGMQMVEFTDGGGAAYDDNVVILASPPAYTAGQLTWCVKQYKGVTKEPTLSSSNKSFAKINKKDRQENAFTVWANFDQLYTALTKTFPEGQMPQEILHMNHLADFGNMDDLIASLMLREDGIALEANVSFKDGYNGLGYNMFRTPKLDKAAFEAVPSEAIVLLSVALNGADSPQNQMIRQHIQNASGLEIGGDIFVNIEQITLFVMPSGVTSINASSGIPPFIGSTGFVLTSENPRQTRQILTGLLTATNLIANQTGDDSEANVGRYQFELVNKLQLHCYTNQEKKTTVLSLNPGVIEASASALGTRRSVNSGGSLKDAVNKLSPGASKLALINVGGAIQAGGPLLLSGMDEPGDDVKELVAQVVKSCEKTTVQLRTQEESGNFNIRAEIRDLPPVSELFGPMMQLSQMVSEARGRMWAQQRETGVPANVRKASRPVVIDGKAEALWSEAREYKIGNVIYSPISSDGDFSASYKTLWDAQNLYVLVDVTDDSLKNDSDDFWQDDAVELFIDADNSKSGGYGDNDYQFHFGWAEANPSMGESQHNRTEGVEYAVGRADAGYRVEIKFPWTTLGVKPSAGAKIGLDVHVNDDDDGGDRDIKLAWHGKEDNAWQTPRAFGTAELAGLIGWWKLDETSGRDVEDASGNGNIGKILNGQPRWQPSGGKIGGALLFDGKGDWVHVANESNFDCTSEVTVAAWIKVNRFDKEWQAIVTKGDSAWRIQRYQGEDSIEFACSGLKIPSDSPYGGLYGAKSVNDGKWHHVAGVYNGEKMILYVDGREDVSQPASGPIGNNDQPVYIGENAEMTGRLWNGLIDDVRVYNYALDQATIAALYNEGK
ncbi:MAG: tetratricopeptide repeat protein [Sedimentisphaerales bacterium]|nr:tetratricopeptide repeat protein [Sedimentisphaerales bacterium]